MPQHKGCLVIKASFSCCNPWCLLGAVALRGMMLLLLLCSFFFLRELPCTCHVPRSVSKPGKGSLGLFGGWLMLVGLGTWWFVTWGGKSSMPVVQLSTKCCNLIKPVLCKASPAWFELHLIRYEGASFTSLGFVPKPFRDCANELVRT